MNNLSLLKKLNSAVNGGTQTVDLCEVDGMNIIQAQIVDKAEFDSNCMNIKDKKVRKDLGITGKPDTFEEFKNYYDDEIDESEMQKYYDYYLECIEKLDPKNRDTELVNKAKEVIRKNELAERLLANKDILDQDPDVEVPYIVEAYASRGHARIPQSKLSEELKTKINNCVKISGYFNNGDAGSSTILHLMKLKPSEIKELLTIVGDILEDKDGHLSKLHDRLDSICFISKDEYLNDEAPDEEYYYDQNETGEYNTKKEILDFFEYDGDYDEIPFENENNKLVLDNPSVVLSFFDSDHHIIINTSDTDEAIKTKEYLESILSKYWNEEVGMFIHPELADAKFYKEYLSSLETYEEYNLSDTSIDELLDWDNQLFIVHTDKEAYHSKSYDKALEKYRELVKKSKNCGIDVRFSLEKYATKPYLSVKKSKIKNLDE